MRNLDDDILNIIKKEVGSYIINNLRKSKRRCLYCGNWIEARRKDNFFCHNNQRCYRKYHRIPGFIRKLISHRD